MVVTRFTRASPAFAITPPWMVVTRFTRASPAFAITPRLMVVTRFTRASPAFAITSYNPKIREAMMFFWICDVPPITLCARL